MLQRHLSCCHQNLRNADEIVSRSSQDKEPFDESTATMAGLAQAACGFHPAEWLFDSLALDQAFAIAGMPGCAPIDRRAAICIVLRDVRRAAARAAGSDEL